MCIALIKHHKPSMYRIDFKNERIIIQSITQYNCNMTIFFIAKFNVPPVYPSAYCSYYNHPLYTRPAATKKQRSYRHSIYNVTHMPIGRLLYVAYSTRAVRPLPKPYRPLPRPCMAALSIMDNTTRSLAGLPCHVLGKHHVITSISSRPPIQIQQPVGKQWLGETTYHYFIIITNRPIPKKRKSVLLLLA